MSKSEAFLQIWGMEAATTQRVLNAVPEKNITFRADPKARTAIELAAHVASHGPLIAMMAETGEVRGGPMPAPRTIKEAIAAFPAMLPKIEKALKAIDDKAWDQKIGTIYNDDGSVFQSGPVGMLLWFTLFDLIHHRGQLSTYLRPMGGKVPSIYGPSADDSGKM